MPKAWRWFWGLTVSLFLTACVPHAGAPPLGVSPAPGSAWRAYENVLEVRSGLLGASINLLLDRSPSFLSAMERMADRDDFRIQIGYHADFPEDPLPMTPPIAAALPLDSKGRMLTTAEPKRISGVRVIVTTGDLEAKALLLGYPLEHLVMDLATVLAHEIYAHAVPFWEAETVRFPGPCTDPLPDQAPVESCAVQRENVIRREIGVPERTHRGESDLGFVRFLQSHAPPRP